MTRHEATFISIYPEKCFQHPALAASRFLILLLYIFKPTYVSSTSSNLQINHFMCLLLVGIQRQKKKIIISRKMQLKFLVTCFPLHLPVSLVYFDNFTSYHPPIVAAFTQFPANKKEEERKRKQTQ